MIRYLIKIVLIPVYILLLWAAGYGLFVASVLYLKSSNPEVVADAIVVPTGGDRRIEAGLTLLATGHAKHLFITGVHPGVTHNTITAMWQSEPPLPDCCITLGHRATTTIQNAAETKDWVEDKDYKSIILVTSNYHMNRAWLELMHALPGIKIIRHPVEQPDLTPDRKRFWILTLSEYNKALFRAISLIFNLPSSYSEGSAL